MSFARDAATTEIYTLSLHDALPISCAGPVLSILTSATGRTVVVTMALVLLAGVESSLAVTTATCVIFPHGLGSFAVIGFIATASLADDPLIHVAVVVALMRLEGKSP